VFSPDQALQWFKAPPIQGTQAENEFLFVFHAVNLSKAGYTVIPDLIREDTFLSRTEVDELFDFSRTDFSNPDGKCCANAQECAFTTILNSHEGIDAAQTLLGGTSQLGTRTISTSRPTTKRYSRSSSSLMSR
jgi:hypothetical protein